VGLDRDTSIVADAGEAGRIISLGGLPNLETDEGAPTVAQMLLEAHRWVFDRLRRRFSAAELALVTNTDALKLAVCSRLAEVLSAQGLLGGGERAADEGGRDYWGTQAKEQVDLFRPEFSDSRNSPRASSEGVPAVGHVNEAVFSDHFTSDLLPGY
jgi:hypothetical protein